MRCCVVFKKTCIEPDSRCWRHNRLPGPALLGPLAPELVEEILLSGARRDGFPSHIGRRACFSERASAFPQGPQAPW